MRMIAEVNDTHAVNTTDQQWQSEQEAHSFAHTPLVALIRSWSNLVGAMHSGKIRQPS